MHTNNAFLIQLADELDTKLEGHTLELCFSQDKDQLMLVFSNIKSNFIIQCEVKPTFSGFYFTDNFARARKNSVDIWSEIFGLKVKGIRAFRNERAMQIELENGYKIAFKFFGNRPNILLFKDVIQIGRFNNSLLSDAEIKLTDLDKTLDYSYEKFQEKNAEHRKVFFTLGKQVFNYLEKQPEFISANTKEKYEFINKVIGKLKSPTFYIGYNDGLPVLSMLELDECVKIHTSAIAASSHFYVLHQSEFYLENQKKNLEKEVEKEIKKTENYISETSKKLEKLKNVTSNEHIANILMANLHEIKEGAEKITLLDFYQNQPLEIKLKKELSPQKNAENYYRKSKNEKIEFDTISKNIAQAQVKLLELEEKLQKLKEVENHKELKKVKAEQQEKPISKADLKHQLFKVYTYNNYEILVGKNAKNNDILTMQYAQKEDLWLHARDCAGSHVVIKKHNNDNIPLAVIERAASLAAYFSKKKNESLVTVIYTPKKFIRKGKGLKDGEVIVQKESTLLAEPTDF